LEFPNGDNHLRAQPRERRLRHPSVSGPGLLRLRLQVRVIPSIRDQTCGQVPWQLAKSLLSLIFHDLLKKWADQSRADAGVVHSCSGDHGL